jgi:hypothetical protein
MMTFLEGLPVTTLPVYVVPSLFDIPASDEDRRNAQRIAGLWAAQRENMKLQSIVQQQLKKSKG